MAATQAPVRNIDIDTLYHILSHLTPDPKHSDGTIHETLDSKAARKTLSRLARVHSSFTQPVLTVMWRSLPSQKPLEHLLCVVEIAQRRHRQHRLDGPPLEMCGTPATHESGWKRFQEYAALVREIIIDPFVRYADIGPHVELLEDTFWCQLSTAFGNAPILPHLKRGALRSVDSSRPIDMGVLRLLNPSGHGMRELEVTLPQASEGDLKRLKRALAGSFSSIETLDLLVRHLGHGPDPETVESLPSSHPHLHNLKLRPHGASITVDHLRHLAALTCLESLTFSLYSWQPPKYHITFNELCSLELSCSFGALGVLLAHVDAPRLQSFSISESHSDSNTISKEFPGHLSTLLGKCASLTAFKWNSTQVWARKMDYVGDRRAEAPLAELVAPLLSHRAMQSFVVRFDGPIVPYTPADFRAFAEAWPDLDTFRLYHDSGSVLDRIRQRADVECVVAFARHCPRLRNLKIPRVVQFESDPSVDSMHLPPAAPHWLRELRVNYVAHSEFSRSREFEVQFRGLMKRIFPFATVLPVPLPIPNSINKQLV